MKNLHFKSFPSPNHIEGLVEVLRSADFTKNSGCVKIDLDLANKLGVEKTNEILNDYNPQYDLLVDIFEEQKREANFLVDQLTNFFSKKSEGENTLTVYKELFNLMIRVYRILEIQNPDYSVTKAFNKKMGKDYETSKGFWITDDCERKRVFSKNLGEKGWDLERNMEKLLNRLGYDLTETQRGNYKGFNIDYLGFKDGQSSLIELKVRDRNRFFDSYMATEMWIHYKSIYKN